MNSSEVKMEKIESYVENSFILRLCQKVFTYFSPLTIIFTTLISVWIHNYNRKRARMVRLIEKIPGPPALPFVGESSLTSCGSPIMKIFGNFQETP